MLAAGGVGGVSTLRLAPVLLADAAAAAVDVFLVDALYAVATRLRLADLMACSGSDRSGPISGCRSILLTASLGGECWSE